MKALVTLLACIALVSCSSSASVDPNTWTCDSLIEPVIAMSKDKELQVMEITSPRRRETYTPRSITCDAQAEWSQGKGSITYGAHVSDGNQVILEYKQD